MMNLRERDDRLAVEPAFLRQARERRAGESPELLEVLEVLFLDVDLFLQPLGVGLELLDQLFLGPDLLPRVLLDGPGAEPRAEHAQAFGPLGIERAILGLGGQGGDQQFERPFPFGNAHFASHQRLALVDRDVRDLAGNGPRRRPAFSLVCECPGRGSAVPVPRTRQIARRPSPPPAKVRRSFFVLSGESMGSDEARGRGHLHYPSVGRSDRWVYSPEGQTRPSAVERRRSLRVGWVQPTKISACSGGFHPLYGSFNLARLTGKF